MKNCTQKVWKRITALLAVFVMLLALPVWQASADNFLDKPCSITFFGCDGNLMQEAEEHEIHLVMDVYQLAAAVGDGNGYVLYGLDAFNWPEWSSVKNGKIDPSLRDELANRAAEQIGQGWASQPYTVPAGETVENLSSGAYLCFLRADGETDWLTEYTVDGVTAIVSKVYGRDHDYIISPSLVILPVDGNDGGTTAVGPIWNYTDGISFKPKQLAGDEITIYKRDGDSDDLISGVKFDLYCTTGEPNPDPYEPGQDFITVNAGGEEIPLFLLYSGKTDEDGKVTFPTPYPNALYALVETEAPEGYTRASEPYFFYIPSINDWAKRFNENVSDITIHELTVNKFTVSSEELSIDNVDFSNWTYYYTFKNETEEEVRVRAKAFANEMFTLRINQKHWELKEDGYYYYKYPLGAGQSTPTFYNDTHELTIQYLDVPQDYTTDSPWGWPPLALIYECTPASDPQWNNAKSATLYPEVLDTPVITIYNYQGSELPETGGRGTAALYWTGGLLTAGAALLLADRKRRKNASV